VYVSLSAWQWALLRLLVLESVYVSLSALPSVYVSLSAWQWALLRLSVLVSVYVSLSA
jgi:hypothetical protein